jgi:hypothetical protein
MIQSVLLRRSTPRKTSIGAMLMHNRVVYVPAQFAPEGEHRTVKIPTGKTTPGFFGEKQVTREETQFVQTGISDCDIDAAQLANDVTAAVDQLNVDGYEVIAITPLTSGNYNYDVQWTMSGNGGAGYGYGYSYTKGVLITARRMNA